MSHLLVPHKTPAAWILKPRETFPCTCIDIFIYFFDICPPTSKKPGASPTWAPYCSGAACLSVGRAKNRVPVPDPAYSPYLRRSPDLVSLILATRWPASARVGSHLQSHASGHFPQLHRYLCWLSPLNYLRSHTRGHFFTSRTTQRKGDTES
ncbi:uncharacterized protein LOC135434357 isoform X1 [Drosophila montana]|uniref:uncharacterized protein LOC135430702 isoform X1 n=1 Tax=Drosophila montana TaxID=40370 RepID=UPI00313EB483